MRQAVLIGEWLLDTGVGQLRHNDGTVNRLTPKALDVLLILVEQENQTVSREDLLAQVWTASYPSDYVVSRAIADIRVAFGETAKSNDYIKTVPKKGYRLIANIEHNPVVDSQSSHSKPSATITNTKWFIGFGCISLIILVSLLWRKPIISPSLHSRTPITSDIGLEHVPRVSNGGDWVLYSRKRKGSNHWDVVKHSLTDNVTTSLTTSTKNEFGAAISPHGDEIAFVRVDEDKCHVVVQSANFPEKGESLANCTNRFATLVDWSPSHDLIAFTAREEDSNGLRTIHVVNRKTKDSSPVTSTVPIAGTDYYPRFSPDGNQIAFLRGLPQPKHQAQLYTVDLKTKVERLITSEPAFHLGHTWLDKNRLLVSTSVDGQYQSSIMDLGGTVKAVNASESLFQPDFDPISSKLVMSKLTHNVELMALDVETAKINAIAESTASDNYGSLSPNGRWMVFVSDRSGKNQLWLYSMENKETRKLASFERGGISFPHWKSDSETLVFTATHNGQHQLFVKNIITDSINRLETGDEQSSSGRWFPIEEAIIYSCHIDQKWKLCRYNMRAKQRDILFHENAFDPTVSGDESYVYFTSELPGLWQLDLKTGNSSVVWQDLPKGLNKTWAIDNKTLIYVEANTITQLFAIKKRELTTGKTETLYNDFRAVGISHIEFNQYFGTLVLSVWKDANDDIVLIKPKGF